MDKKFNKGGESIHHQLSGLSLDQRRQLLNEIQKKQTATKMPFMEDVQKQTLSSAQERMYVLHELTKNTAAYHVPILLEFEGDLNVDILKKSLLQMIHRHQALRSVFVCEKARIYQKTLPFALLEMPKKSFAEDFSYNQKSKLVRKDAEQDVQRPFDLSQGPLMRTKLYILDEKRYMLLINFHHIIIDGWSIGIFIKELSIYYNSFMNAKPTILPDLAMPYSQFIAQERQWLTTPVYQAQLDYWKKKMDNALPMFRLPTDYMRPEKMTYHGKTYSQSISKSVLNQLETFSKSHNCTLYMILLTVFNVLLCRYSNEEDIVVGTPFANRNKKELEPLIGFFVNTLPLRIDLSENPTGLELIQRVRQTTLEAYSNQAVPFSEIVQAVNPARNAAYNPLFQVMFVLQNAPIPQITFNKTSVKALDMDRCSAIVDLALEIWMSDSGLKCNYEYNTDLFKESTIKRMANHFEVLMNSMLANPNITIAALPMLSTKESQQLLCEFNDTKAPYPDDKTIDQLFEEQAARTPDACALIDKDTHMSFQELNRKANGMASFIGRKGQKPDPVVGLFLDRSCEMIIGILGAIKSGCAYLPLDPTWPASRLEQIIEKSHIKTIVTTHHYLDKIESLNTRCQSIVLDRVPLPEVTKPLTKTHNPDDTVYVLFTSGSTGSPKGVKISHRSLVNHMWWMTKQFKINQSDRVLFKTPATFDASVWEYMLPLITGATLIILPDKTQNDTRYLKEEILKHQITIIQMVPTLFNALLKEDQIQTHLKSVRYLFCGGEVLTNDCVQKYHQLNLSASLVNLYGPTECTIDATSFVVDKTQAFAIVPIGKPIHNVKVFILDKGMNPVPPNIPGEICISGVCLAQGYISDDHQQDFIEDIRYQGRLYKTGDRGFYTEEGNIICTGRMGDNQIKLYGYRIDCTEIEVVFKAHPDIQTAVVYKPLGSEFLIALYISHAVIAETVLLQFLNDQLPHYMIPQEIIRVEGLPLTASGKINRSECHQLYAQLKSVRRIKNPEVITMTRVEATIREIWARILEKPASEIDVNANFNMNGGNSLSLVKLLFEINEIFNINLSLMHVLNQSITITNLAKIINAFINKQTVANSNEDLLGLPVKKTFKTKSHIRYAIKPISKLAKNTIGAVFTYYPAALESLKQDIETNQIFDVPFIVSELTTPMGNIVLINLPIFENKLYSEQKKLRFALLQGIQLCRKFKLNSVSLAGLLPSATNFGLDVTALTTQDKKCIQITNGYSTIAAVWMLNIQKVLTLTNRSVNNEVVGFLGMDYVSKTTLKLMLSVVPHPTKIILCDTLAAQRDMLLFKEEIISKMHFKGKIEVVLLNKGAPKLLYEASLIVGAIPQPDLIEIQTLASGTIIVSTSFPRCFNTKEANERLIKDSDILFVEGRKMKAPFPIKEKRWMIKNKKRVEKLLPSIYLDRKSHEITGCIYASILKTQTQQKEIMVGAPTLQDALEDYRYLINMEYQGAELHCDTHYYDKSLVNQFAKCLKKK